MIPPNVTSKNVITVLVLLLLLSVFTSCASNRRAFAPGEVPSVTDLSPEDEDYGHQVMASMMSQYELSRDDRQVNRVEKIVDRLAQGAHSDQAPWHVYLFDDEKVENAAATRGNYIFVWSGILKRTRDDDELAAILAHEMSHVLAGHTMPTPDEETASMMSSLGGTVAGSALQYGGNYGILADLASNLTTKLLEAAVVNPEQQRKELEADQIGLFVMAKAHFDPNKAVEFWERMNSEGFGDAGSFQFMTTHPSSEKRLAQLHTLLPDAELYYSPPTKKLEKKESKYQSRSDWTVN